MAASLSLGSGSPVAMAQQKGIGDPVRDYPSKPVRWIIDGGPGGLSDSIARTVSQRLTQGWGQSIVNDNRSGASGTIAYDLGAKAPPDGYTLLFVSAPFSINVSVYDKLPYDTRKDFAPIALLATYSLVLVTSLKVPAKNVSELITYAKDKRGGPTWATTGPGSSPSLATELFRKLAGFNGINVQYKSSPAALIDLIAGRIDFTFVVLPSALTHIRAKRIQIVGVASPARSTLLPDVPTIAESGLPGFQSVGYTGAVAPAKVPRAIIDKLNADMVRAVKMPDIQDRIQNLGAEARWSTPEEFKKILQDEIARWAPVAREAGVKLDL